MYLTLHQGPKQLAMLAVPAAPHTGELVCCLITGRRYRVASITHLATDQLGDYHAEAEVEPVEPPAPPAKPRAPRRKAAKPRTRKKPSAK